MKAKCVYENLDFERGKDPKKSMQIGKYKDYYGKSADDIARIIINEMEHDLEPYFNELVGLVKKKGYDNLEHYQETIWDEEEMEPLPDKEDPDIEEFIKGIFVKAEAIIEEKYPVKTERRSPRHQTPTEAIAGEIITAAIDGAPYGSMVNLIGSHIDTSLLESLDFERGQDPKEAMDIGLLGKIEMEKYIKHFVVELDLIQGYDGFPWNSYEDYVYEEIEEDLTIIKEIKENIRKGMSPLECALSMANKFDKGEKYDDEEDLDENLNFERGQDPTKALGIGMEERIRRGIRDYYPGNNENRWTGDYNEALEWAASTGQTDIIQWLLDAGADPTHKESAAMKFAAEAGEGDAAEMLIKAGADPYSGNGYAMLAAKFAGHPDVAKRIQILAGENWAKTVHESLEFERGGDVITSIGVGLKSKHENLQDAFDDAGWEVPWGKLMIKTLKLPANKIFKIAEFPTDQSGIDKINSTILKFKNGKMPKFISFPGQAKNSKIGYAKSSNGKMIAYITHNYLQIWGDLNAVSWYSRTNESLKFERGKDPKSALDVGLRSQFDTLEDRFETAGWRFPAGVDMEEAMGIPAEDIFQIEEFQSGQQNRFKLDSILLKFNNGDLVDTIKSKKAGVELQYAESANGKMVVYYDSWQYAIWGDIKALSWYLKTNESQNFERGQDPKRALGIGAVKVHGDRGANEYNVILLEPYNGQDKLLDEEIWKAKNIDNGEICYVVKYPEGFKDTGPNKFFGEIDPFIESDE